ncbi:PREDICTED: coiled-coil domain-containing protein 103 [Polistes canadensis]|uniref:coiled-coil domain-containing protein 103 n=1 Tax=Polistes canadensis TaxID=91411 RepID=UPI000718C0C6|nr:PREDICTED: coiled-coil domain-containing protein 103 [Polistes canadensis]
MSILKSPIDYKILQDELYEALKADELYKLQNDAKIRAVEQGVPTYEHFRQMVNGAHLKALEPKDTKSKSNSLALWNSMSTNHRSECLPLMYETNETKLNEEKVNEFANTIPKDYKTFIQMWRNTNDSKIKFFYLYNTRDILKDKIFYSEIPPFYLTDIINTCLEHQKQESLKVEELKGIIEILTTLSKCNRFNLAINFMSDNEKENCSQLLQSLKDKVKDKEIALEQNVITSLIKNYQIV